MLDENMIIQNFISEFGISLDIIESIDELLEQMAEIGFRHWVKWKKMELEEGLPLCHVMDPQDNMDVWRDLLAKSYSELDEESKEEFRKNAEDFLAVITKFISEVIVEWRNKNGEEGEDKSTDA